MSDDLVKALRAMARREHDDLSLGDEAADEIERLRQRVSELDKAIDFSISQCDEGGAFLLAWRAGDLEIIDLRWPDWRGTEQQRGTE